MNPNDHDDDFASICHACIDGSGLESRTVTEMLPVRGVDISVTKTVQVCRCCGARFLDGKDLDFLDIAYAEYRRRTGMLTPAEIRAWRTGLNLTQPEVTALLGWGGATLGRYENGALQSAAHERQLRELMEPAALIERVRASGIADHKKQEITGKLANQAIADQLRSLVSMFSAPVDPRYSGNRVIDHARLLAVTLFLAGKGELKTKLNKLLFFADFVAYRERGQSITGLAYARWERGPVPKSFETIRSVYEEQTFLAVSEVDFGQGIMGEKIAAMVEPDLGCLGPDEIKILRMVKAKFQTYGSKKISDISHEEPAWLETEPNGLIDFSFAHKLKAL